jgi:hypothetical protein
MPLSQFWPGILPGFLLGPGNRYQRSDTKGLSLGSHLDRIVIHVWGGELIVTMPGSSFRAVYHKPANQPQLVAKEIPTGTHEFRARAWWEACQRARSMGWIM